MGYEPGLAPTADYIAIKMPVFSFEKLRGAEILLMRSAFTPCSCRYFAVLLVA